MSVITSRTRQQPPFLAQGNGVIYIKIARKDNQGNDNTLSLQELDNIRLKLSDAGIVDYPITNITEYPDYYLYQTSRINVTSSTDNNIKNYAFSASIPAIFSKTVAAGDTDVADDHWVTNTDNLNYFNSTTGVYTFGDTPNIKLIYSVSIDITASFGNQNVAIYLSNATGSNVGSTSATVNVSTPQTVLLSGTSSFIENSQYVLKVLNNSPNSINYRSVRWVFTQSINPQSSSNLTVLEPYLTSNFEYSDCNVLLNNASQNQIGSFYRRVLYDNDSIIPSNFQEILSQSAEYAEVKDYNYSARAQVLPRYDGVRTTSPDFNLRTINIDEYEGTKLNSIATGDPNVQILTDKFAVFDWMGGADPEIRTGGAGIHLTQLINPDGTIIGLTPENKNLFAVEQIFKPGSSASVYFLTTTNTNIQNFQTSIYDAGAYYNSLMAVSGTFDLNRPPTYTFDSYTQPYFILSGSSQISSVITASYGSFTFTRLFISEDTAPPGLGIGKYWRISNGMINVESSLFPTQQYDIIRFYPTSSIDEYYTLQGTSGSNEVIQRVIMSQSVDGNNFYFHLDSPITASQFPSASNDQGFRIYRRIPNETFVYINDYQAGSGLLIPGNYDTNLDYLQIARKAGLL